MTSPCSWSQTQVCHTWASENASSLSVCAARRAAWSTVTVPSRAERKAYSRGPIQKNSALSGTSMWYSHPSRLRRGMQFRPSLRLRRSEAQFIDAASIEIAMSPPGPINDLLPRAVQHPPPQQTMSAVDLTSSVHAGAKLKFGIFEEHFSDEHVFVVA